ncbi:MAG: aminoacyl-tRNA hydrolase [Candidatus Marinimicrobia bacterium]|nr:aminoacyl-tRNA hydrolase [Candidatus Neomarinimicrobiota bacterium]
MFVGLGNIGDEYSSTKHNAGFWVVNELAKRMNIAFKPGKGDYVYAEDRNKDIILIKPTTGMNRSGLAVRHVLDLWNVELENLYLIVDDVDLNLGTLRIRPRGGDGCHRGMESVIYQLSANQFPRIRFGIKAGDHKRPAEKYVLKSFRKQDQQFAEEMVQQAADAAMSILNNGINATMNKFNRIEKTEEVING